MLDPYKNKPARHLLKARDNRGKPGEFDYYISEDGMVFLGSIPENLSDYYEGGYHRIPQDENGLSRMARSESFKIDPLKKLVPEGAYLEIGPWIGMAAYSALKAGYDVSVMEMNPACVSLLSSVGIKAHQTSDPARSIREAATSYDVIAMWHSIEHLPRPWEVLDAAIDALNPGGVILICAPNPESAQFRVHREKWLHLDAPRHIYFMPMSMVIGIGQNKGLELIDATTDDPASAREELPGWSYPLRRKIRLPIVRKICGKIVAPILAKRHRRPGEPDGASFTIIMRKPSANGSA